MPESTDKNYFLGSLTAEAAAVIELRVVESSEFAAELAVVEENLIEDYLDNTLSADEANLFRANYLNTEERINNVEMTALMKRYARENVNNPASIPESSDREVSGLFQWFNSLSLGFRLAGASVALIVLMTSVWFVLRPQRDNELIALQDRYEQINRDPNSISLDAKLSELTLVSDNLRASGSTAELSGTDLTENVRFRVALPRQTDTSTTYNVTIYRDSTEVFRQNNIRPLVNRTGAELRLILPRQIFTAGRYRLDLTSEKAAEIDYRFVVR